MNVFAELDRKRQLNDIERPIFEAAFHGETWYRCPRCNKTFEFYDTKFERGFKHVAWDIYEHVDSKCGQKLNMR